MRSFFESRPWLRHVLVLALVVGVLVGLQWLYGSHSRPVVFSEGEFVEAASSGRVESAVVWAESRVVEGVVVVGGERSVYRFEYLPAAEGDVLGVLRESVPDFVVSNEVPSSSSLTRSLGSLVVVGLVAAGVVWLLRRQSGGVSGGGLSSLLPSSSRPAPVAVPDFGFDQLGGVDEAIVEVSEVVEFLSDPERFTRLGAKPPRGVLLEGPPGTGKTALARAAAAEARVPFFALSASEFVEMFVGVGARRVRDLFRQARENGPAVVFIDEIDAVGRRRSGSESGSNAEREATLNQLLTEMDGFVRSEVPVVVMAATNRADILDAALLRRFPRRIHVPLPDRVGRERILRIHLGKVKADPGVDVGSLAARTISFSGSDLERLVNEAAVFASRDGADAVSERHLELAFDRIVLGLERRSAVSSERDRLIVAYHEAGHTLCALLSPGADQPSKVSLVPRGAAGGVTHFTPSESAFMTRRRALGSLCAAMGGRAAEEVLLGDDFTSGAAHDLQSASQLARDMVARFGMSDLGPVFVPEDGVLSPDLAAAVEAEVRRLVESALDDARRIVADHRDALEALVEALLEEETLDGARVRDVVAPTSAGPLLTV